MLLDTLIQAVKDVPDTLNRELARAMRHAVRFKIDNVARYYAEEYHAQQRDLKTDAVPNVAPLAPIMWFEFAGNAGPDHDLLESGCLIEVIYDAKLSPETDAAYYHIRQESPETRWVLSLDSFARARIDGRLSLLRPPYYLYLHLDKNGGMLHAWRKARPGCEDVEELDGWAAEAIISLLSICFAHCKGTIVQKHGPGKRARRTAYQRGLPLITFHTLDIRPTTRILSDEGQIATEGLQRALHICRGHFAHYTEEHPLFGKYVGTVYRPMHTRGSIKQGAIKKDYRVSPNR